ncbi:MAG: methyltransferase domain-containing protein [Rhodobacteraceae bacterium]|nr:methyltransferase domain-containing protein [Paracoccaceae bacterium]
MDGTNKHLAARYDAAAESWHRKIAPLGYPKAYGELVQALGQINARGFAVLDAGAGCGDFSSAFVAAHGAPKALTLLDISADMLKAAKARLRESGVEASFIIGDIESRPATQNYGLILCAHVVEHCPEPVAALRALRNVLQPDGKLLLVVSKPHWCTAIIRLIWRSKAFSPAKTRELLAEAGFETVEIYGFKAGPPSRTSMGYIATLKEKNP